MNAQYEYLRISNVPADVDLQAYGREGWGLCGVVGNMYVFLRHINPKEFATEINDEIAQDMRDLRQKNEEMHETMNKIARALHPNKPTEGQLFIYVPSQLPEMITKLTAERDEARQKLASLRLKVTSSLQVLSQDQ